MLSASEASQSGDTTRFFASLRMTGLACVLFVMLSVSEASQGGSTTRFFASLRMTGLVVCAFCHAERERSISGWRYNEILRFAQNDRAGVYACHAERERSISGWRYNEILRFAQNDRVGTCSCHVLGRARLLPSRQVCGRDGARPSNTGNWRARLLPSRTKYPPPDLPRGRGRNCSLTVRGDGWGGG